jgi:plasmid replication initiation protein
VQEVPKNKMIVVKHNDLIDAAQKLSIYESRIILTCISLIDSKSSLDFSEKFVITVEDIVDLVDVSDTSVYNLLKEAVERLSERWVVFMKPSQRVQETRVRWVYKISYIPTQGTIELSFSPDIIKLLTEISRDFTQYKLENVLKFRGFYSVRLYELMCRWGGKNKTIELEWLKENLQLEDSYSRWDNFKNRVIEPAIRDINEFSNMKVKWTGIKRGKSIHSIKFEYHINKDKKSTSKIIENISYSDNSDNIESTLVQNKVSQPKKAISPKKSKYPVEKNDDIDNVEYFADIRKRYGDAAQGIPVDVIELLKSQGRW